MFRNCYEKLQTTLEHGRCDTEESAEFVILIYVHLQGYTFKFFSVVKIHVVVF